MGMRLGCWLLTNAVLLCWLCVLVKHVNKGLSLFVQIVRGKACGWLGVWPIGFLWIFRQHDAIGLFIVTCCTCTFAIDTSQNKLSAATCYGVAERHGTHKLLQLHLTLRRVLATCYACTNKQTLATKDQT